MCRLPENDVGGGATVITIRERPSAAVAPELLERLRAIPPAEAGHLLDFGFMDPALRPIGRKGFLVCGPAVTVRAMAVDSAVVHKAIELAQPGDVLVIDRNGERKHACWGEMTSIFAQERGVAATIIDGPATDIVEIEEMGYLVFSRGVSPITTRGLALSGEINTPIQCGGVPVSPGDIVLADDNGVLILPPDLIPRIIDACEARVQRQLVMRERLRAGVSLADLSGANEKLATRDEG
jgi:regulator of RNase E activity RraA